MLRVCHAGNVCRPCVGQAELLCVEVGHVLVIDALQRVECQGGIKVCVTGLKVPHGYERHCKSIV